MIDMQTTHTALENKELNFILNKIKAGFAFGTEKKIHHSSGAGEL